MFKLLLSQLLMFFTLMAQMLWKEAHKYVGKKSIDYLFLFRKLVYVSQILVFVSCSFVSIKENAYL